MVARYGGIHLTESLEQTIHPICGNARASIADFELEACPFFQFKFLFFDQAKIYMVLRDLLTGKPFAGDFHHDLSLFCKFERIAYEVNQDLAQSRGVADDGFRRLGITEISKINIFLGRARTEE